METVFDEMKFQFSSAYCKKCGGTPPGFAAFLETDVVLKRVNAAIRTVMGDKHARHGPVYACVLVHLSHGMSRERIITLRFHGYRNSTLHTRRRKNICGLLVSLLPVSVFKQKLYPRIRIDELSLEKGRFVLEIATTENHKISAAILDAIKEILRENVK